MQLQEPAYQDVADRETQQLGQGMEQAGGEMARLNTYFQQQANQVRVQDAYNQALQAKLNLTYDPQNGFLAQKGDAALNRPDGQSLPQEYGQKFNDSISQISAGLGNDQQRQAFMSHAGTMAAQLQGEVDQHLAQEYRQYHLSTNVGTIKLEASNAALNWQAPDKVEQSVANAKQAAYQMGTLQGKSAQEIESDQLGIASGIHLGVIEQALKNGNYAYAQQYLAQQQQKAEKGGLNQEMTGEDLLKANGLMTTVANAGLAQAAVDNATKTFSGNFAPTNTDAMVAITAKMESGGKDFDASGAPTTSAKGAKYAMQVMPATAQNPGFGIQPAAADNPVEYNRVGKQYLMALASKFGGDPAKTWAAYNAGPGAVDNAVAQSQKDGQPWLSHLPAETQAYVSKGMGMLQSGQGMPPTPTELDFVNHAVAGLPAGASPQLVAETRSAAKGQFALITKARADQADQLVTQAQQQLIANNGNFNAVDPSLKMQIAQLAPDKWEALQKFGVSLTGSRKTDLGLYGLLTSHPDALFKMSDGDFNNLQANLSDADFKHLANVRQELRSGTSSNSPLSIDNTAVNTAITNRLTSIGITPPARSDTKGLQQVGTVQKFVRDTILSLQAASGKKFSEPEINTQVDNLFAKNVAFRQQVLGGLFTRHWDPAPMLGMKIGDIPEDDLNNVKVALANHGNANPTEDQILRTYWSSKLKQGR